MKRAILTFVALVALATTALAQEPVASVRPATNDFRGRVQGAFEWEPVKNLSVEAGLQLRLKNDLGSVDCFHTSVGIGYEVNDHFSFGAEYIIINGYDSGKSTWEKPRHRLNINDSLILANVLLIALLAVVEYVIGRKREVSKLICFERIELIRPERRKELIADLESRLGHKINRVEVGNVDFLRDVAFLKVYYTPAKGEHPTSDDTMKINEKNAFNK